MLALKGYTLRNLSGAALLLFLSCLANAGTVTVSSTVTPVGALFQYAYSIANTTPDDAFLIDIPVSGGMVENISTPLGFKSAYDSGLGLVSFLEDTSTFGPTPQSGFSFDSPGRPGAGMFEATLVNGAGALYTISGTTAVPTPEPAYLPLFALLVPAVILIARRRRESEVRTQA